MVEPTDVPDIRKTVTVRTTPDQAFTIFAERPIEWWPDKHVFVEERQSITIEPRVGGRYYERGIDGIEIAWGTIVEWDPPKRVVLTWRVGKGWQPIYDDEKASFIEVDFRALDPSTTEVALTHSNLHRHGDIAPSIHAALDGPSPGDTLANYSEAVRRNLPPTGRVTLVNTFTLSSSPEEFERAFASTAKFFAEQPGFLDHQLTRQVDEPEVYVNIARWQDEASLRSAVALPEFSEHVQALGALASSESRICADRVATEL